MFSFSEKDFTPIFVRKNVLSHFSLSNDLTFRSGQNFTTICSHHSLFLASTCYQQQWWWWCIIHLVYSWEKFSSEHVVIIKDLPRGVFVRIFSYLNFKECARIIKVNKQYFQLATNVQLIKCWCIKSNFKINVYNRYTLSSYIHYYLLDINNYVNCSSVIIKMGANIQYMPLLKCIVSFVYSITVTLFIDTFDFGVWWVFLSFTDNKHFLFSAVMSMLCKMMYCINLICRKSFACTLNWCVQFSSLNTFIFCSLHLWRVRYNFC